MLPSRSGWGGSLGEKWLGTGGLGFTYHMENGSQKNRGGDFPMEEMNHDGVWIECYLK